MVLREVSNAVSEANVRYDAAHAPKDIGDREEQAPRCSMSLSTSFKTKKWGKRIGASFKARKLNEAPAWRAALMRLDANAWFGHATTALVLANIVVLSMPNATMPASYATAVEIAALVITWLFICEMSVKVLAHGWKAYWKNDVRRALSNPGTSSLTANKRLELSG
eukprot:7216968-Prymnesium_polylepis.4